MTNQTKALLVKQIFNNHAEAVAALNPDTVNGTFEVPDDYCIESSSIVATGKYIDLGMFMSKEVELTIVLAPCKYF